MSNEWIFIISVFADILFVFFAAKRSGYWLAGTIVTNLILISILGSKLITVFGMTTNAGNVFYACVFLATHFIIERHGKKYGMNTIWGGFFFIIFFTILSQLGAHFVGLSATDTTNTAISTVFSFSLRVTIASIISYIVSQYVNVTVYEWFKLKTKGRSLWLRSNGANIVSQLVDSLLFFSIAFFDLPGPLLLQTILAGWCVKTLVVLMGTPFLYLYKKKI